MKAIVLSALLAVAMPAMAVDFGQLLDLGRKAVDSTKKLSDANRDFTAQEEIELGDGITATFLGATPLHPDQNLQRYVNRVGLWVALHSARPDLPWTFGVIDTDTVNAFAMPGGTVLVSHGLLKRLANESELAGVLGHEIAHVVKKHQLAAIQSSVSSDVWSDIGKTAASEAINRRGGDAFGLKSKAAGLGVDALKNGVFLRPLDRSMEYEADRLGVVLAARSGYDPFGLVAALQMLSQVKPEEGSILFSTHPAPGDRLSELEGLSPTLEKYAAQPQVEPRFKQSVK